LLPTKCQNQTEISWCFKNAPVISSPPFIKSTLPFPSYFIKILVSSQGTDGLTVYVLKGRKFNFLLHLKYPWACETVIFFYWVKIQPLWGVTSVIPKSCNTLRNSIKHIIVYCQFQRDDEPRYSFVHSLQSNRPSPLSKCHPVPGRIPFREDSAAFLFNLTYMSHRTKTLYFPRVKIVTYVRRGQYIIHYPTPNITTLVMSLLFL
jgi:hypothetical protein